MKNNIKIQMDANKNNITFARGAIASFLVNLPLTINFINEIKTVISEAVTNAIVHGYNSDESKKVYLEFELSNDVLTMIVKDNGIGIENIEKAGPIAIADHFIVNNSDMETLKNQVQQYIDSLLG